MTNPLSVSEPEFDPAREPVQIGSVFDDLFEKWGQR